MNLTLDAGVGMLVLSDGFGDYYDQMDCKWNIEAQGPITVVLTELNTKDVDVLTITEPDGKPLSWSGDMKSLPQSFMSKAARMTVTFTSVASKAKAGGATASSRLSGFRLELYAPTAVPTTVSAGAALPPHTCARTQAHNAPAQGRTIRPATVVQVLNAPTA